MNGNALPSKGNAQERIRAAALKLFADFGYKGVSTRDIALAAGVNEVTIFRHYPRKRDLYLAVLEFELVGITLRGDLLTHLATAKDGHSALERAHQLIAATVGQHPDLLRLLQYSALERSDEVDGLLKKHLHELLELIAGYLKPWIANGELRGLDAKSLVFTLVAVVFSHDSFQRIFSGYISAPGTALYLGLHDSAVFTPPAVPEATTSE